MVIQNVKVNTFLRERKKPFIDNLSKLYIFAAGILGLNRMAVILNEEKYILAFLTGVYSVILSTSTIYISYIYGSLGNIVAVMSVIEYMFDITFSCITWKRVERYYNELSKFDFKIGCRPRLTIEPFRNFTLMVILNVIFTVLSVILKYLRVGIQGEYLFYLRGVLTNLLHCLELYYYGHLLSLLVSRLRLINYFIESALSNGSHVKYPKIEEFRSFKPKTDKNINMKTLMDLYHTNIKAYDFLVDAIKWQLLVVLITTFLSTLVYCYDLADVFIRNKHTIIFVTTQVQLMVMEMFPLFSPCVFADRVHGEVRRLRELLASRLYENKLDKHGRSAARALLALTEARDLSFSLLRMIQMDISLPFKFIGLLITYLIIMLQFEKVLSPQAPPT